MEEELKHLNDVEQEQQNQERLSISQYRYSLDTHPYEITINNQERGVLSSFYRPHSSDSSLSSVSSSLCY